jgi:hypothetical protein
MNDNNLAEEKAVETDTTQTSSPAVESPITGDETMQGDAIVQTPVVEESDVPTDIEEQRRAFQELRLENKRLKEEKESKPREESAFDALRAQTPPVQSGPIRVENFVDPITGETNWQEFNQAQQSREQQILQQARYEAKAEVQETLDEERARAKYPELMNDPVTEKQIASRWLYEKINGNNVSISDIASEFARNFKQAVSKAEKIGAERILNEVSEKEKAGLTAASQSSSNAVRETFNEDQQQLVVGTRMGNNDAITARLSKIPWANK